MWHPFCSSHPMYRDIDQDARDESLRPSPRHDERSRRMKRQLITMAVDALRHEDDSDDLVPLALRVVKGVEAVQRDPATARVWVFGNGSVQPRSLIDALNSCGCGGRILENQFELPA